MSYIDHILHTKKAENGGNNPLFQMWGIAHRNGLCPKLLTNFRQIETMLSRGGYNQNAIYTSLSEAMETVMYAVLVNKGYVNQLPEPNHSRYCTRFKTIDNAVRNNGMMHPGMGNAGTDFTVSVGKGAAGLNVSTGVEPILSTTFVADDPFAKPVQQTEPEPEQQSVPAYDSVLGEPVAEAVSMVAQPAQTQHNPINKPNYETLKGKRMMNYAYHELSTELKNSESTVRAVASEVKKYTDGNRNIEAMVNKFFDSGVQSMRLDENNKFVIERNEDKLEVMFGENQNLQKDDFAFGEINRLINALDALQDLTEADYDIDDLVRQMSHHAGALDDVLRDLEVSYEDAAVARKASIFSRMVRGYLNDALSLAWYGITDNTLPASYVNPEVNAKLSNPLVDVANFYTNIYSAMYVNDLGVIKEETFITNVAMTFIKALRSCIVIVEQLTNEEEDVLSTTVSVKQTNYNLVIDCNIATSAKQGQISSVMGMMSSTIENIYRAIDKNSPEANVYLVTGGLYAKLIGSSDESSVTYFATVE